MRVTLGTAIQHPLKNSNLVHTLGMLTDPAARLRQNTLLSSSPKLLDALRVSRPKNRVTPCPVPPARRRVRTAGDGPNAAIASTSLRPDSALGAPPARRPTATADDLHQTCHVTVHCDRTSRRDVRSHTGRDVNALVEPLAVIRVHS